MQDLKEYRAIEDEETRAAAFAKYVRKQKVSILLHVYHVDRSRQLQEKLKELSEDGGSATSRKRKEPSSHYSYDRERERDSKSRHHRDYDDRRHGHDDDYDRDRTRDRDYRDRDRDYRDRERDRDYRDRDRERDRDYRSSRYEREERDRDRDRGHRSEKHRHDAMDVDPRPSGKDKYELDYADERARKVSYQLVDTGARFNVYVSRKHAWRLTVEKTVPRKEKSKSTIYLFFSPLSGAM